VTTARTAQQPDRWTRGLLRCGLAAGPVFTTTFLVEGAARDGYRPLRHPVSSLALGRRGWIQAANFTVTGTLFLAGAAGLRRTDAAARSRAGTEGQRQAGQPGASTHAASAFIAAAGLGLLSAAIFPTDPVSGYPPGTPPAPPRPTPTGIAHNLAAVPFFAGLPAAALASSRRSRRTGQRGFARYSTGTALTMLTTAVLSGAGFGQSPGLVPVAGLLQRISIITGLTWLTARSGQALRR
jgi:hypothetical protein